MDYETQMIVAEMEALNNVMGEDELQGIVGKEIEDARDYGQHGVSDPRVGNGITRRAVW